MFRSTGPKILDEGETTEERCLVSREKAKVEPTVSEKVKNFFWLVSAWQKSMHLEAKEESTVAIFLFYLNQENKGAGQRYMLPL